MNCIGGMKNKKMASLFIDIHAHAYRIKPYHDAFVPPFCTAEELVAAYKRLGIAKGVVLPIVSPEIYFPQTNEDVLDICQKYSDILIPYCNIDPRMLINSPEAPLNLPLQYYKDKGCKGIGEVMPSLELINPYVQNLLRHAESVGLPLVYDGSAVSGNGFGLFDEAGLPYLEISLQRFPKLKIFGHGPIFWSEIACLETKGERGVYYNLKGEQVVLLPNSPIKEEGVVPKLLRKYKNLYADLSDCTAYNALARDPKYGPTFLEEFQDKAFFGTDIVSPDFEVPLIDLLKDWRDKSKLSKLAFEKITHGNAIRLLNL